MVTERYDTFKDGDGLVEIGFCFVVDRRVKEASINRNVHIMNVPSLPPTPIPVVSGLSY
jgi:hypothetical protein